MVVALMLAALLGGDPDEAIVTARADAPLPMADAPAPAGTLVPPKDPHGLTTDQQIQRWMSAPLAPPGETGPATDLERRIQGQISVEIGTGDRRAYGGWVDVPVGQTGTLSLSYGESRGRYLSQRRYGPDGGRLDAYGADDRFFDRYW